MLPSEELAEIQLKYEGEVEKAVIWLFAVFQRVAPVDKGHFRNAWELKKVGKLTWTISNNMEYATVLFDGRRLVAGKWYGSEQWPEGGHAILARFDSLLQKRLDRI